MFPAVFPVPPDEARGSRLNRVTVMFRHTLSSSLVTCYPDIRRYIIYILTASLNKQYKYKLITNVTLKDGWPTNEYHWRFPWRRVALWDVSFGPKCCISFRGRWRDSKILSNVCQEISSLKISTTPCSLVRHKFQTQMLHQFSGQVERHQDPLKCQEISIGLQNITSQRALNFMSSILLHWCRTIPQIPSTQLF